VTTPLRMGRTEWLLLLALAGLWGASFFFYKVMDSELPPFTVVLGRVGLAAIILNLVLAVRRDPLPLDPKLWRDFLVLGLFNCAVPFTLYAWGETRISSGMAAILNAATPIFTILVAQLFTQDEKLNWNKTAGVLFGFAGVGVLVGPDALRANRDLLAEAGCLLATLFYGVASVYGRRFAGLAPLKVATGQVTASAIILLPFCLVVDRPWLLPMPSVAVWGALAGIALLSTALAYILFFRILAVAGATNIGLVTFLLPISALLLGTVFLGEHITFVALLGMALIGIGLAAIDGRPWTILGAALRRL
jgi:drug/metabolite transporter (DMT)-like permease